jgi:phenylpyruvate tautomerase
MPTIKITSSASSDKATKEKFALALSKDISKLMNKPEAFVQAIVDDDVTIVFGGSAAPSAFVVLRGIGGLSPEVNKTLSKAICARLKESFAIEPGRVYINFENLKGSDWGWNGETF